MQSEIEEQNKQKSVGLLYLNPDDDIKSVSSPSSDIYDTMKEKTSQTAPIKQTKKNIFQGMTFDMVFRSEWLDFELSQQTENYLRVTGFEESKNCFVGKLYERINGAKAKSVYENKNWKQVRGKSTNKLFRQYKIYVQYDELKTPAYYKIVKSATIGIIEQHPEVLIYQRFV